MKGRVYLRDHPGYYKVGNAIYNKRNQVLIPDKQGRYKLKNIYNAWESIRIEGPDYSINWAMRKDTTKLKHIENFPGYFLDGNSVVNRWGITLRPQRTKYYRLKDSKGVFRSVRLETLQSF